MALIRSVPAPGGTDKHGWVAVHPRVGGISDSRSVPQGFALAQFHGEAGSRCVPAPAPYAAGCNRNAAPPQVVLPATTIGPYDPRRPFAVIADTVDC
jgi:hypothetical protein